MAEVKFCGLTSEIDATFAGVVGADYAGVIFAGGPRHLTPERAVGVLGATDPGVHRVGVFGRDFREWIPRVVERVSLDVVQLHGDPTVADVRDARNLFDGIVWAAVRIAGSEVPPVAAELFGEADAVLVDAATGGRLGGTGTTVPWHAIAADLQRMRSGGMLILAGGLTASNVDEAIDKLDPDVVDVSSGIESAPGVKDHEQMTAFVHAVRRRDP